MATFVLVPGFWVGAWGWRDVAADLRGRGHRVLPLSLTGLGDRAHLARPAIGLGIHVADVLNVLRYGELDDVVLVGHSYAGAVVLPMVADRAPELLRSLVFVDSGPLPNGTAQQEFTAEAEQEFNRELVRRRGDGWRLPPPDWFQMADGVGLPPAVLERMTRLSAPQPWHTATDKVSVTGAWEAVPRSFVLCSFTEQQVRELAGTAPLFRHMTDTPARFRELPGWHWPMFQQPAALAEVLHELSDPV
jgi:pimeloyl-ACP methyl ester carboxylesterase